MSKLKTSFGILSSLWMFACSTFPLDRHGRREPHHSHSHHSFKDVSKWSKVFDDPARDQWQQPDFVIHNLDLDKTKCVADIGAGTGYFSMRIARHLAKTGTVLAIDSEPDMIAHLKTRAQKEGIKNQKEILATVDFPKLPIICDMVLLVDTYHHLENRTLYFKSGRDQMTEDSRVAIVDFTMESPVGPQQAHRLPKKRVIDEMHQAGFKLQKEITGLPYQYFLIFKRI